MRKIIYLLFLFASVVASGLGIGKTEVQASALPQIEGTTKTTNAVSSSKCNTQSLGIGVF